MISTKPTRSVQSDIDVWTAGFILSNEAEAELIARLLFSTPKNLRARLSFGGVSAIIAAMQIIAAMEAATVIWPEAFPRQPTRGFLSSAAAKVTVSGN